MRSWRIGILVLGVWLSLASAAQQQDTRPPDPQEGYYNTQPPIGDDHQGQHLAYSCYGMRSGNTVGSLCFPTPDRCERERAQAQTDGAQTTECRALAPVSCFQMGGDPNPSMEVCAQTPQDCDLWRLVDQDKNGKTGGACEWRHWMANR